MEVITLVVVVTEGGTNQEEEGIKEEEDTVSKVMAAAVDTAADTEVSLPSPPVALSADESIHTALTPFVTNSSWNLLSLPCP